MIKKWIVDFLTNDFVVCMLTGAITGLIFAIAIIYKTDLPDVYFSYSTGKCVRVELPDGKPGSCDKLPEKYNHYFVK